MENPDTYPKIPIQLLYNLMRCVSSSGGTVNSDDPEQTALSEVV